MKITTNNSIPAFPKLRGEVCNIIYPCYVEVKIDGEANVYFNGTLTSKASGKIRRDFPVTQFLERNVPANTMLFGELYWGEGKAGALYDFLSHQKDNDLRYCIFDAYNSELDGKTYEERREWIIRYCRWNEVEFPTISFTRPLFCENKDELFDIIAKTNEQGWEGVVVKNANSILYSNGKMIENQLGWIKIKQKATGDYMIYSIDPQLERMEVVVGSKIVGVKLVNKYKPLVKVGDTVEIEHMGVLSGGGLRHPVFRGKVVK